MVTIGAILLNSGLHSLLHWESARCGGSCLASITWHSWGWFSGLPLCKNSLVLGKVLGLSFASDNSQTSPIAEQVTGSKLCPAGCYLPYSSLQILWDLKMGSLWISFYVCDCVGLSCANQSACAHSLPQERSSPMTLLFLAFEILAYLFTILIACILSISVWVFVQGAGACRGRRTWRILWSWNYRVEGIISFWWGLENWTWVLCKINIYSYLLSYLAPTKKGWFVCMCVCGGGEQGGAVHMYMLETECRG